MVFPRAARPPPALATGCLGAALPALLRRSLAPGLACSAAAAAALLAIPSCCCCSPFAGAGAGEVDGSPAAPAAPCASCAPASWACAAVVATGSMHDVGAGAGSTSMGWADPPSSPAAAERSPPSGLPCGCSSLPSTSCFCAGPPSPAPSCSFSSFTTVPGPAVPSCSGGAAAAAPAAVLAEAGVPEPGPATIPWLRPWPCSCSCSRPGGSASSGMWARRKEARGGGSGHSGTAW